MNIKLYKITLLLLLTILVSSCNTKTLDLDMVEGVWIPSLDEVYPAIEGKAYEIDPKVKLQRLSISLFPDKDNTDIAIQASFDDKLDGDIIYVHYYIDGTITAEVVKLDEYLNLSNLNKRLLPGINLDEKIMSVPDALSTLMNYADIDSSYRNRIYCSELILEKYNNPEFDRVIWWLVLRDCGGIIIKEIEMDAYTGELYYID